MFAGVSWDIPEGNDSNATILSESDYFRYGQMHIVCRSRTNDDAGTCEITLWDGATFTTETKRLRTFTRDARQAQLVNLKSEVPLLAKLYGVQSVGSRAEVVTRLLDFEFPTSQESSISD